MSSPPSSTLGKAELPAQLARWLDALDETGRWALLKLVTGASARRRVGAARQDRGSRARRQGAARDRVAVARTAAALYRAVRLARRPRRQAGQRAIPRRSARPCSRMRSRTTDFRRARPRRLHGGMEMGRHPRAGCRRHAATTAQLVTRLYSRTGEDISKSFPDLARSAAFDRRHRRRTPGAARGPRAVVQRAAAAAQPQNARRRNCSPISRPPARLRPAGRRHEDLRERPFAERRARLERLSRGSPIRASTSRRWCRSRPGTDIAAARQIPAAAGAGDDADAVEGVMLKRTRRALCAGTAEGAVVEMEARSVHRRCGADVRAARHRQAFVVLFRLHLRRLDGGRRRR